MPVVVDREGAVVWVPHVAVAWSEAVVEDGECGFFIAMKPEADTIGR